MWPLLLLLTTASAATPSAPADPLAAPADLLHPPANATTTASGLRYVVLVPGKGDQRATPRDHVLVDYTGWTSDGHAFDSTASRGQPADFRLGDLIPGWVEGIQLMAPGSKVRMWIPVALAYNGAPGAPAGDLVFDVELHSIVAAPRAVPVPFDVNAPPPGTPTSPSGVASRVLTAGTGATVPTLLDTVDVTVAGWLRDGTPVNEGAEPMTVAVATMAPALAETVQTMVVGERRRVWVPATASTRALTFELELVAIHR